MFARVVNTFLASILIALLISPVANSQIVVPDAKKFTETDCRWLHSQFLGECVEAEKCTWRPEERDFSMSTQRGMSSLETVLTVRSAQTINQTCYEVCKAKKKVGYQEWRKLICKPLIR